MDTFPFHRMAHPYRGGLDVILTAPVYYFCIPNGSSSLSILLPLAKIDVLSDPKYAVVPSLGQFRFPKQLPRSWEDNSQAPILSTSTEGVTCRITSSSLPLETAHIVPATNVDWWQDTRM